MLRGEEDRSSSRLTQPQAEERRSTGVGISRISHMFRLSGLLVLPRVSRTSLSMRNGNRAAAYHPLI